MHGYKKPLETFEINFNGTLNLIDAFLKSKISKKILVITTDKVYKNNDNKIFKENDSLWGNDPYSASKVAVEQLVHSYRFINNLKDKQFLVARSGNVIGGGDICKDRIVPDIIKAIKKKNILYLRNSNSIRPWQHVLDPLIGYLILIFKSNKINRNYVWNFGPSDKNFKRVVDIVNKFKSSYKFKTKIKKNFNKETNVLKLNSMMAKKNLNWSTKLNFNESINYIISFEKLIKRKDDPYKICLDQIKHYFRQK